MATVEFEYDFCGITLSCEADVDPYIPAHTNCLPENAYPAEGGDATVTKCEIVTMIEVDGKKHFDTVEFEFEELFLRSIWFRGGPVKDRVIKYTPLEELLNDAAYQAWMDGE